MKKCNVLVLIVSVFITQSVFAQISGSAHDFSEETWNSSGEICITCHTPHEAKTSVSESPLWNHQVTTETFTLFTSNTFDATAGQPEGSTKLCLSCHDGTVAVDNFGGTNDGTENVTGTALLGTDLSDDHPVSFTYDATLASGDGELADPTSANSGLGGTIQADMLENDKVQCSSCHDVHDGSNAHFLLMSNTGSALCLTCHTK